MAYNSKYFENLIVPIGNIIIAKSFKSLQLTFLELQQNN